MFPGFNLSTDPNIYIDTESESRSVSIVNVYIQGVPGGMDKTSGECSLC